MNISKGSSGAAWGAIEGSLSNQNDLNSSLNNKTDLGHNHQATDISNSSAIGRSLVTAADAPAVRTLLALGSLATQSGTFSGTSSGTITLNAAALANATTVTFTLTNTFIAATDFVMVQHASAGTLGAYNFAVAPGAGSAAISVRNIHTASLSEAIVLRFVVIKAVTS